MYRCFLHESEECAIRKRKSRERLHYEAKEEKGIAFPIAQTR